MKKWCNEFISYTRYFYAFTGDKLVALITNAFTAQGAESLCWVFVFISPCFNWELVYTYSDLSYCLSKFCVAKVEVLLETWVFFKTCIEF